MVQKIMYTTRERPTLKEYVEGRASEIGVTLSYILRECSCINPYQVCTYLDEGVKLDDWAVLQLAYALETPHKELFTVQSNMLLHKMSRALHAKIENREL